MRETDRGAECCVGRALAQCALRVLRGGDGRETLRTWGGAPQLSGESVRGAEETDPSPEVDERLTKQSTEGP